LHCTQCTVIGITGYVTITIANKGKKQYFAVPFVGYAKNLNIWELKKFA